MQKFILLWGQWIFLVVGHVFSLEVGQTVPDFHLSSADHQSLSRSDLQGRLIIGFYESRDSSEKNNDLKARLRKLADGLTQSQKNQLFVLAVADCSQARWPFTGFWEAALAERGKQLGYTLWGDWSAAMREDFGFQKEESNFFLVDDLGRLRYFCAGKIEAGESLQIVRLILNLLSTEKQ